MTAPEDSAPPFRWGLVGAGGVARQFARSVSLLDGHRVRSVASRTKARAEAVGRDLSIEAAFDSYRQLVEDPKVDAVYVATPPSMHAEHVGLALAAGKPVLCEKPFAPSGPEAAEVVAEARAAGVFCMEAMWMRFIPAISALRAAVRDGEIGEPRLLEAELGFNVPFSPTSRYYDPAFGGGAMLDLGVYLLSLAWFLLGPPESGRALVSTTPSGVDAQATIALRHEGGALASLTCSFDQRLRNSAFIAGTGGSFELDAPVYAPSRLAFIRGAPPAADGQPGRLARFVEGRPSLVALRRQLAPMLRQVVRRERAHRRFPFAGHGYQFEAQEVARCVREGRAESEVMPLDETVEILRAIDALRSAGAFDLRRSVSTG